MLVKAGAHAVYKFWKPTSSSSSWTRFQQGFVAIITSDEPPAMAVYACSFAWLCGLASAIHPFYIRVFSNHAVYPALRLTAMTVPSNRRLKTRSVCLGRVVDVVHATHTRHP